MPAIWARVWGRQDPWRQHPSFGGSMTDYDMLYKDLDIDVNFPDF